MKDGQCKVAVPHAHGGRLYPGGVQSCGLGSCWPLCSRSIEGGCQGLLAGRRDGAGRWHSRIHSIGSPTSSCGPAHLLDELSWTAVRTFSER